MQQVVHRNADGELVISKKLGSRQRGYLVETWHHGHYAAGVATFRRDIDTLAESLLGPGRARCHAIGPDWDSYHLMSDEPGQCPSAHGRVAPYPPAYEKITKGFRA